jgi:uncharacterized protein
MTAGKASSADRRSAGVETRLNVRVQPRASRDEVVGFRDDGVLVVRVSAAPVEGQANAAVEDLLADVLGVRKAAISVVRGERGRDKVVRVSGLTAREIGRRVGGA